MWQRIKENIGRGEATLVYNTNNELGYTFRTTRKDKTIVDSDGIPLMKTIFQTSEGNRHGFSNAYKYHQAKKFSRKIKAPSFVALDLETTGLNPRNNQIISIGAVKTINGQVSHFYRLIKLEVGKTVPSDIAHVTKLSDGELNTKGINLKEAIVELKYFAKDLSIVGYNLLFDERFLQVAIIRNNIIQFNNKMIDVLPYIKQVEKFSDDYHFSTILKKYGIQNDNPHNSLADAVATMKLVNELIKKQGFRV